MRSHSKKRIAFRPTLNDICLEDRVVLNVGGSAHVASLTSAVRAQQANSPNTFTRRELQSVYRQQFNAAQASLRQYLSTQISQLYANGRPTAEQLANFKTQAAGAINATAFRISSQLALLPRATDRLVANLQDSLLSNNGTSLVSRINRLVNSPRINQSAARLDAAINRSVGSFTNQARGQFTNYLTTTPIYQLSQDATSGARIPLAQYMAQQVVGQFGNSIAGLAQSFPTVANTAIFNNGVMSTDPAVQQAFASQLGSALGVINNQLASNIGVFQGLGSTLAPVLQQSFYGTGQQTGGGGGGTGFTNLYAALSSVPTTSSQDFLTGVNTAFNGLYSNVSQSLTNAFRYSPTGTTGLPTGPLSNPWGPVYQNFGNGFNSGFGTGVMGFGQSQAGSGNSFGNGFSGLVTAQNTAFGFNQPVFQGFGLTTGIGTTGTGTIGTGTTGTGITGTGITGTIGM